MKKSITLAALLLVIGTSVFAASPAKSRSNDLQDEVYFAPLKNDNGFAVEINKETAGKSLVIVYDNDHNVIFKDLLSKQASAQKGYLISSLDYGDYTVEIVSGGQSVKKTMHVYDDGKAKSYFFFQ